MFGFYPLKRVKAEWDRHLTNIPVAIGVQSSNVYGFLCLLGDLGGILVDYVEVGE